MLKDKWNTHTPDIEQYQGQPASTAKYNSTSNISLFLSFCTYGLRVNYAFSVTDCNTMPKNASGFTMALLSFFYLKPVLTLVLPHWNCGRSDAVRNAD